MITEKTTAASRIAIIIKVNGWICLRLGEKGEIRTNNWWNAVGILEIIPAVITNEMPLPIPLSWICSPSHIINIVPVVSVRTVRILKPQPACITIFNP